MDLLADTISKIRSKSKRLLLLAMLLVTNVSAFAQHFILTPDGMRCSDAPDKDIVLYSSLEYEDSYEKCYSNLNFADLTGISIEKYNHKLIFTGNMKHISFMISGTMTIRYIIYMEFQKNNNVAVRVSLTKENGKNFDCGKLFGKNGKIKNDVSKEKIESQINSLVKTVLGHFYEM